MGSRLNAILDFLDLIANRLVLLRHVVRYDTANLDNANKTEEEVDSCQTRAQARQLSL